MKKKKILLIALAVIVAFGIWGYFNFGKLMDLGMRLTSGMKHRDPATEKAAYTLTAQDLSNQFKTDTAAANKKYINQSILVDGSVTAIEDKTVSLDNVACTIDSTEAVKLATIKVGDKVKLQGLVVGYNDLLEEISISQCRFK